MIDRYRVLFGAGVLAGGMSAAMLAGAGVAGADDGASSADSGTPASSRAGDAKAGPQTRRDESSRGARAERVESRRAAREKDTDADAEAEQDADRVKAERPILDTEDLDAEVPDGKDLDGTDETPVERPTEPEVDEADTDPSDSGLVRSIETDLSSPDDAVVLRAASIENPWLGATNGLAKMFDTFNDIGTAFYNLYTRTMEFLAGPLRAPFGSRVRAERSTLVLGDGLEVKADWYFPTSTKRPTGIIYLQHGILATASFYNATAAYLAEKTNSIVVAPTLTWNVLDFADYPLMLPHTHSVIADLFLGDREALHASARLAGYTERLPDRVVFAGHSAGGGAAVGAAGYYAERGGAANLAGVVMLDGVPFLGAMAAALDKIPTSIPVYNLSAEPDSWNGYGAANYRLSQARPGEFTGIQIGGGKHSDTMRSTSPIVQFLASLATGFSAPWNVATSEIVVAGWMNDLLNGTHTAHLYGAPGSSLEIPTGWWWRPAVDVLPVETLPLTSLGEVFTCLFNPSAPSCHRLPSAPATPALRTRSVLV
ncbi:alpha/beta hydrolase [Mycobacterium sp. SMC-4]|uniref:alpha/beta hydrolase n=1 Tax=Mycobacterium sp. SMC-4 TaxID=2857059 RepID=UPI003D04514D